MAHTKMSYSFGSSATSLLGQTIGQNLRQTCKQYPQHTAIISMAQNIQLDYTAFWQATTQIAKSLIAIGIQAGDRLGIWAPNRYEWTLLQYATARIGVILVNINPAYRVSELEYVINQSAIKVMAACVQFKSSHYKSMIEAVRNSCPSLEHELYFEENWNEFLAKGTDVQDEVLASWEERVQIDDPVNIQYTSGTTGFPKGVTLSHHSILNNGFFIGERLQYSHRDRVCIPVPFYHCFGMVIGNIACTTHGATMVIPGEAFDPERSLLAVEKYQCTSLYGVPTMFIAMLALDNFEQFQLGSLRTGVMAGSPCPVAVMKEVKSRMHMSEISVCYGMTETSPVSLQTKIGVPLEKQVSTVGTVMDHLEVKIIDPASGHMLPQGTKGELCTRGYSVMLRYWNNPIATEAVKDAGGWMHTGDEGLMDEEGYITITGRIKDLIIRGGENISPKEVEDFLYTHESIEDVQVIGVPDEKFGEQIMAWVKLKAHAGSTTEQELTDYCKQNIAHYKVPRYWKFVESFPMTITGKIKKNEMRAIAAQELGLNPPQ